jgi:hypothetical protein
VPRFFSKQRRKEFSEPLVYISGFFMQLIATVNQKIRTSTEALQGRENTTHNNPGIGFALEIAKRTKGNATKCAS